MDNRKAAVVLLAFLVLLPAAAALNIPFIDIGGGGGGDTETTTTDGQTDDSSGEVQAPNNDFVPYINQEVRGTGIPAVTVKNYVAAETTDYSSYSCYMTESDNKMVIQEASDRSRFETVEIDQIGRVNFRVDAPESEVGSSYSVVTQCFGPEGEPTNIIKIEFTTKDNFPDAEHAYGAGLADESVVYYNSEGEPRTFLDQYGPTAERVDSYRSRYSMENVRVSSCSIEPRNLEKGEEYTLTIDIENNKNHPVPVKMNARFDTSNFDKLGYESFGLGLTSSLTRTVEPGSSITISKTSDFDFGGFASAYSDERRFDIEDIMGLDSHEVKASVTVPRPGSDSSCTVSCGLVAINQNPTGQVNGSRTCSGDQSGSSSAGSESGGSGFYSGSPDYNQVQLQERRLLVNETQVIYAGLNSSQSNASIMVEDPEGDRTIYNMDGQAGNFSYTETSEVGGYEVFLGPRESFETNSQETSGPGQTTVDRVTSSIQQAISSVTTHIGAGITARAVARFDSGGGGGGGTTDSGTSSTSTAETSSGSTEDSGSFDTSSESISDPDPDYWDRAIFEVISYPAWKQYCNQNIDGYSPDPQEYNQVNCLEQVRDACFTSNPGEGCEGVPQSVCELNDMHYHSSENACSSSEPTSTGGGGGTAGGGGGSREALAER